MISELRNQDICRDFDFLLKKGYKVEMVAEIVGFKYYLSPDRVYEIFRESIKTDSRHS